jgi:4-hydroxy-2-oxoheptanedioate aldolase
MLSASSTLLPKFGVCVTYPEPGIIERIGADWDWIWLDGQHGELAGYDVVLAMIRACDLVGRSAYYRVPGHEPSWMGLALDAGATGIIVPQIDSAEEATLCVRATKFPPVGNRSYGARRIIDRTSKGYNQTANTETKLICQIESPGALEAVEEIAAVPGVDGLFLGPNDMLLRLGEENMTGAARTELLQSSFEKVAAACRRHGKESYCLGFDPALFELAVKLQYDAIVVGGDAGFLAESSKQKSTAAREIAQQLA